MSNDHLTKGHEVQACVYSEGEPEQMCKGIYSLPFFFFLSKTLLQSSFHCSASYIVSLEDVFQFVLLASLKLNFKNTEATFQNNRSIGYKSRSFFLFWDNGAPTDFVKNQLIAVRAKL